MSALVDARTAERYRSLLLGDIEYLHQILRGSNPVEHSYNATFLSSAHEGIERLTDDLNRFYQEVKAPNFRY